MGHGWDSDEYDYLCLRGPFLGIPGEFTFGYFWEEVVIFGASLVLWLPLGIRP